MTVIFKAKTHCAYTIKILAELLQNNIKTACFELDEDGIKLSMMDHHETILIKLSLESENFTLYKFKLKEKKFLGINLNHFHRMLKSIKKKDSLQLFINDEFPNDLGIKVIPKENNRITTSFIKIQEKQNISIEVPNGYDKPVIVPLALILPCTLTFPDPFGANIISLLVTDVDILKSLESFVNLPISVP